MNFKLQKKETDELTNDIEDFSLSKKKPKKPAVNLDDMNDVRITDCRWSWFVISSLLFESA